MPVCVVGTTVVVRGGGGTRPHEGVRSGVLRLASIGRRRRVGPVVRVVCARIVGIVLKVKARCLIVAHIRVGGRSFES